MKVKLGHIATHTLLTATAALWLSGTTSVAQAQDSQSSVAARPVRHESSAMESLLARRVTLDLHDVSLKQALKIVSERAGIPVQYQVDLISAYTKTVTLRVTDASLRTVFDRLLDGTALTLHLSNGARGIAVVRSFDEGMVTGTLTGTITDLKTRRPLSGVTVTIDNAKSGVRTDPTGEFRIAGVSAGQHRVSTRLIGYARAMKTVAVDDDKTTVVDFELEPGKTMLDQVVVTGTVVATELKSVPNAITVITAKQIEERGITRLDQFFRGDVPGLFAMNSGSLNPLNGVAMFSRGASNLRNDGNNNFGVQPIKTYVDGVELADPRYLNQIDPKSVERIEILTGPQASTIYGSNAINGVMQIFTKRGRTARPQVTLSLLSGLLQNNFGSTLAPQHDYSAQVSGVEGHLSYNAGASWLYTGRWTPAIRQSTVGGSAGARAQFGTFTTDLNVRMSSLHNDQNGSTLAGSIAKQASGLYVIQSTLGLVAPARTVSSQQTVGATVGYAPFSWWSHELVVGTDVSETGQQQTGIIFQDIADSSVTISQTNSRRTSIRYSTTARLPLASWSQLTVTAGADGWKSLLNDTYGAGYRLTGPIGYSTLTRQPEHNAGGFVQGQLALRDVLFFTYGLRGERNPNYGEEVGTNYSPRYGVAYTRDLETPWGPLSTKLRGSYGKSTKPPTTGLKAAIASTDQYIISFIGPYNSQVANPDLLPESQQGSELGLELYFANRGSLVVTRYNQTVTNLIRSLYPADSVRSLLPASVSGAPSWMYTSLDADGYGYFALSQNINIADVRNQGWELQGRLNVGPFSTHGTYSWTKSRVIGVTQEYRSRFTEILALAPGASIEGLPEHTWSLGLTYGRGMTTVALNVNGVGQSNRDSFGSILYQELLSGMLRLDASKANMQGYRFRYSNAAGYALADLNATHRFTNTVEGVLQIQNLADQYHFENDQGAATIGRQMKAGARVRW